MSTKYIHFIVTVNNDENNIDISYIQSNAIQIVNKEVGAVKEFNFVLPSLESEDFEKACPIIVDHIMWTFMRLTNRAPGSKYESMQKGLDFENKEYLSNREEKAQSGDPGAQFSMGSICIEKAFDLNDIKLLDAAEEWFKKAAEGGSNEAIDFLKDWPKTKTLFQKQIKRRSKK